MLLIEPVWNRNMYEDDYHKRLGGLLIEPVWNRNLQNLKRIKSKDTFNRTSLELKHTSQSISWHLQWRLLIEPVWN